MDIQTINEIYNCMCERLNDFARKIANCNDENIRKVYEQKFMREQSKMNGFKLGIQFAGVKIHNHYLDSSYYSEIVSFDTDTTNFNN